MNASTASGPRERLLRAAQSLTYAEGVTVGVDAILQEAGVARRSLYQHFGGKDGLIAETLRLTAERDLARYAHALDAGGTEPRERLLAVYDALEPVVTRPEYRGCRYAAAELSLADPGHPAHAEIRAFKQRLRGMLEAEVRKLGRPEPGRLADQLQLLIEGVLVSAVFRPEAHPARLARELAARLLDD